MHSKLNKIVSRLNTISNEAKRLSEKFGYQPYMIERYIEMIGYNEVLDLLEINEKPLPEAIRCNDYLINCNDLKKRLEEKNIILKELSDFSPYGFLVESSPFRIGATHEYLLGYYYIQGPASMSIAHAMDLAQDMIILDMAAAPGGKATQILQITKDKSLLIAVEKNPRRMKSLRSNLQRMRFTNYILLRTDARNLRLKMIFDSILLDAPSTGEGIIRKDPRRKTSRTINDLIEIHKLQVELLDKAISLAKPGASIVYAACSLAAEEGELVIDAILEKHPNVTVEPHRLKTSRAITEYFGIKLDSRIKHCGRYWPHIHKYEGFFICKLRKVK